MLLTSLTKEESVTAIKKTLAHCLRGAGLENKRQRFFKIISILLEFHGGQTGTVSLYLLTGDLVAQGQSCDWLLGD